MADVNQWQSGDPLPKSLDARKCSQSRPFRSPVMILEFGRLAEASELDAQAVPARSRTEAPSFLACWLLRAALAMDIPLTVLGKLIRNLCGATSRFKIHLATCKGAESPRLDSGGSWSPHDGSDLSVQLVRLWPSHQSEHRWHNRVLPSNGTMMLRC